MASFSGTRTIATVVAAAVAIGVGGVAVVGGGGAPPNVPALTATPTATPGANTANLWIDSNGGTCTRQAISGAYSDAGACGTFDAANDACQNGDLVIAKAASYGDQTISGSNSRTSMCTVQAASGETVAFGILTTNGDWLTVKNMESRVGETSHLGSGGCMWCDKEGGSHILLDNVDLFGKWAAGEISGGSNHAIATDVTFANSELGTAGNSADRLCGSDDEPFRVSEGTNINFIHNVFHPFFGEAGCFHLETFRIWDTVDGITWKNNWFDDNRGDTTGTLSSSFGGCPPPSCPNNINLKVIQNYFGDKPGLAGYDFSTGLACQGNVVAYNYFKDQGAGFQDNCATESDGIYVGNMAFNSGGCVVSPNGNNHHNLWIGTSHGTCAGNSWLTGTADQWGSYNLAGDGWHLTSNSPSINAGENTLCQLYTGGFDIEGDARNDGTCDAGIDEFK